MSQSGWLSRLLEDNSDLESVIDIIPLSTSFYALWVYQSGSWLEILDKRWVKWRVAWICELWVGQENILLKQLQIFCVIFPQNVSRNVSVIKSFSFQAAQKIPL